MTRIGQESPEAEHCLWNLERLVALGDDAMANLSLDLYGPEFEESLGADQTERLRAIKERLEELRTAALDEVSPIPPGMH